MGKFSRRAFLTGTLALGAAGCSKAIDRYTQPDLPDILKPPTGENRHPTAHLLNRATYGIRPGQFEQVEKMGRVAWLEKQLDYREIDDDKLELRLRRYDTLHLSAQDLLSFLDDKRYVTDELALMTLQRALYSERQLYEVMVGFWSDHFSIYHFKDKTHFLKTLDDREVIRQHALGKFGDLLRASAHSPAMLFYLDNVLNEKSHPNENYAREIMELHTLGVTGGYTEQDIQEVARCLTGWSINGSGEFEFKDELHDYGEKTVLGQVISGERGKSDGDAVLDILINHPSTSRYVCTKLVRRFVADDPPPAMVEACVQTWQTHDGDIRQVLRTLLTHPEFENAPPKLKRPFELVTSLLRGLNASFDGNAELIYLLQRMGNRPFAWTTPDGYPDTAPEWSGGMLHRWNFALDTLANKIPGVKADIWEIAERGKVDKDARDMLRFFGRLLLHRDLTPTDEQTIWQFVASDGNSPNLKNESGRQIMVEALGLLAASPAFQWR